MSAHTLLSHYGYAGIAFALILEFLLIPFPAETILVFSGVMWHEGAFHIIPLLIVAISSSWIGSLLAYLIGSYIGRPILLKAGRYVGLTEVKLYKSELAFRRYSLPVVGLGRFIAGIRVLSAYVAGMDKMGIRLYMVTTFISATLWAALFIFLGGTVSAEWHHILTWASTHPLIASVAGLAAIALLYVIWRLKHKFVKIDASDLSSKPDSP